MDWNENRLHMHYIIEVFGRLYVEGCDNPVQDSYLPRYIPPRLNRIMKELLSRMKLE
jgi:hypothetical protein